MHSGEHSGCLTHPKLPDFKENLFLVYELYECVTCSIQQVKKNKQNTPLKGCKQKQQALFAASYYWVIITLHTFLFYVVIL